MREREAARKLSDEIGRILAGGGSTAGQGVPATDASMTDALETARRLSQVSGCLPPVPVGLERRVRAIVQSPPMGQRRTCSAAWGALAMAVVFFVSLIAPGGRQVWAGMLRALQLGQTRVELTPTLEATLRAHAVRETLRDLVAAEFLIGRAPSVPKTLPEGYVLLEIAAVSYPDLPSWISQPFFIELCYGLTGSPPGLKLRQYRLLFREYGGITGFEPVTDVVDNFEQVDVSGVPGTLLTFSGGPATYTVVWERDGLLLELETNSLSRDELLRMAQSVR